MHIFPYSRRPGTPAAAMPDQVPNAVKEARAHRAAAVAARLQEAYLSDWVGQTLPVLLEEARGGLWQGHAPNYAEVCAPGEGNLHNVLVQIRAERVEDGRLIGRIVPDGTGAVPPMV